jgi:asparagine synthase (glutamine-hydrolysing)
MGADFLCLKGIDHLFARYESSQTSRADLVQMDALINHLLSIQILYNLFIKEDIPAKARQEAERLGWRIPL